MTTKKAYSSRSLEISGEQKFVVDTETGERIKDVSNKRVMLYEPRKPYRGQPFIIHFQEDLRRLAHLNLASSRWKVLLFLMSCSDFENFVFLSQKHLAEELDLDATQVCKAIADLQALGLLQQIEKGWHKKCQKLHPITGYKGSLNTLQRAVSDTLIGQADFELQEDKIGE